MKKLYILLLFLLPYFVTAQNYGDSWDGYFSFFKIKDLDAGDNLLLTASENAIFSTDIQSFYQEEITTLDGLTGDEISAMQYIDGQKMILIGYKSGLLQLYDLDKKATRNFTDIVQKPTITPQERRINGFYIHENKAYIYTNYGVSAFSLTKLEFGDTYYIGDLGDKLAVNSLSVFDNYIFAATDGGGLRYANLDNSNIVDYNQWQQLENGSIQQVFNFQNNLFISANNNLKQWDGNTFLPAIDFGQEVRDLKIGEHYFSVTHKNEVKVYNSSLMMISNFSTNEFASDFNTAFTYNDFIYVGDENFGLIKANLSNTTQIEFLSPNGPLRNDIFSMDIAPEQVWVTYGDYDFYYNPYPLKKRGLSHFSEEHWTNLPYEDLPEFRNITSVKINPKDPDQVYFASFRDGLMEIRENEVVNFYNTSNSNLETTDTPNESATAIRLGPMDFDSNGDLWTASSLNADGLIKFTPGESYNSFKKYDLSDVISNPSSHFGTLATDNVGNVYMGAYKEGIIGFNAKTKKFAKIKGGKGSGNLPSNDVRALVVDANNQLWIGTAQGLRVLYSPSQMFDNPNTSVNNIVFLDDNDVPQELFANLFISSLAVDGNNNKWIGSTSGVYQVSSDGQKTLQHFTTDNSPLPSNSINSIKIDGTTGKVYIGTEKGLLAFRGTATTAQQNLKNVRAYPNPVRPRFEGMVTIDGLMKNANVKITDIEGNLVYEEFSQGGSIQWDTKAFGKYKVASGVYLVLITSEDQGETKVAKIMIIR